ncbi:MAG: cytochrome C oxidase subunit IV family protein [Bdellovibrionales bacterium]
MKDYLRILMILLGLTALTVGVSLIDFGIFNALIAMLIATIKGALVLLYFMHLKYDDKVYWVIFGSSVFFVILFYFLTEVDMVTRVLEKSTL